jgi:hypothetical protein
MPTAHRETVAGEAAGIGADDSPPLESNEEARGHDLVG